MMEENNYANGPLVVESLERQPLVRSGGGGGRSWQRKQYWVMVEVSLNNILWSQIRFSNRDI